MIKRRAVFLDRDGVLNRSIVREGRPYPPSSVTEVEILPGAVKAMQCLKDAGFVLIVVSNQPDVARGITSMKIVESINAYLLKSLPVDRFIMCYHDSEDNCDCRKPKPGMLFSGAKEFNIDMELSYMVGDRWRDIEAGINAKCKTIFIDYRYDEKQPESVDYKVGSLLDAVAIITNRSVYEQD
ncbi:MAG: HAD family hydrolase [Gammaproteobacteria bacterium]|nr:HAD family hydrolase [Gammaproteobacteria bacterium]